MTARLRRGMRSWRRAQASVYHGYAWRDVVRSVFGHQTLYLAAREAFEDRRRAAAGAAEEPLFGDFLVSVPYFNYGGVVARRRKRARHCCACRS